MKNRHLCVFSVDHNMIKYYVGLFDGRLFVYIWNTDCGIKVSYIIIMIHGFRLIY